MVLSEISQTVLSYSDTRLSKFLTNILYKYPDLEVLTAVSTKPSQPAIQ